MMQLYITIFNARQYAADIVLTIVQITKNVRLRPWSARYPDLSLIEIVNGCRATGRENCPIVHELWHLIEAAWVAVFAHAIQSLYDSMPRCIIAVIAAGCGTFSTDFSEFIFPNFLKV